MQRAVIRVLRRCETMSKDEAGAIAHAGRGRHPVDERCMWCGVDGDGILASLIARGLAERAPEGGAQLPRPAERPPACANPDPFPEGY